MVEQQVLRTKLLGHQDSVNSVQLYPSLSPTDSYLQPTDFPSGLLVSASDDKSARVFDLRINK